MLLDDRMMKRSDKNCDDTFYCHAWTGRSSAFSELFVDDV
jgi:hypothetical protein